MLFENNLILFTKFINKGIIKTKQTADNLNTFANKAIKKIAHKKALTVD